MGRCGHCKTEGWDKGDVFPPCDDEICTFPYYEEIEISHEKGIEAAQDKIYDVVSVDYGGLSRDSDAALQIIKAYLDASGMVIVPREPTQDMHQAWYNGYNAGLRDARHENGLTPESMLFCFTKAHQEMTAAAPNPFTSKSSDEPISAMQLKYEGRL